MSKEEVCSICWDTFKCPKLLPCKHTFCTPCLYEYRKESEEKSNMVCPLCRESCFIPDKGFDDFLPNYFVEAEKISKQCQECFKATVSKVCNRCYLFLCVPCFLVHSHAKSSSDNEDEDNHDDSSIGRLSLMRHPDTKTELICEQIMIFLPEFPPSQNERGNIRTLSFSHNEGVYVNQPNSKTLLKYNKYGEMIGSLPLLGEGDVSGVLETRSGNLLIAYFIKRSVVCYGDGNPNFKHFHFLKLLPFHPSGLTELCNGNIVVGGPTHHCSPKCAEINKKCEIESKSHGIIHIVSKIGDPITQIIQENGIYIHKFPCYIVSSQRFDTFAVCDIRLKKVVIFDNTGNIRSTFDGTGKTPLSFLLPDDDLIPTSVCTTPDGNYVVSDPRRKRLLVLNPYGKYIGIFHCESGDLSHTNSLCMDSENNIWVGHSHQGTINVLRTKYFKNLFETPGLPNVSYLSNEFGLPGHGNIDRHALFASFVAEMTDS